ncbi:MAG: hypothetical protein GXY52_03405 [Chloroflexi bacterium]|nr:hypothetical protein [Chloroflexota bacterium]
MAMITLASVLLNHTMSVRDARRIVRGTGEGNARCTRMDRRLTPCTAAK